MTEWKWGLAVLTNKFKIFSYFYHPSLNLSYHSWVQENVLKLLGIFLQQIFVSFVIVAFCKEYSEKKNIFWKKFCFGLQTNQHESSVVQLPMNDIVFLAETLFLFFLSTFFFSLRKCYFYSTIRHNLFERNCAILTTQTSYFGITTTSVWLNHLIGCFKLEILTRIKNKWLNTKIKHGGLDSLRIKFQLRPRQDRYYQSTSTRLLRPVYFNQGSDKIFWSSANFCQRLY